ncbi:hypothetical protein BHM03_00027259 [Ensete ventricosum]|nr:hypothetical protein BHM03_00027259 [Ensete ventricosum]
MLVDGSSAVRPTGGRVGNLASTRAVVRPSTHFCARSAASLDSMRLHIHRPLSPHLTSLPPDRKSRWSEKDTKTWVASTRSLVEKREQQSFHDDLFLASASLEDFTLIGQSYHVNKRSFVEKKK